MTTQSLPPVPTTVHQRFLMAWHPGDDAAWVITDGHGVWRITRDGAVVSIADDSAVSEPSSLREVMYFDRGRQAMVHVSLPEEGGPLRVAVWDGAAFSPLALAKGRPARDGDGVVYDERRGVLVHLQVAEAEGAPLTVSELGSDGRWQTSAVTLPCGNERVVAGWDAGGGRVVVIDAATRATHAWDGAVFMRLDDFPHAVSGWPWVTFTAPRGGQMVLLWFAPWQAPDGQLRDGAELWQLVDRTWTARPAGALEVFGAVRSTPGATRRWCSGRGSVRARLSGRWRATTARR